VPTNSSENITESLSCPTISSAYKQIMIVDDEPDILRLFRDYLEMKGLIVRTFDNPAEALSEVKVNHSCYGIIVSDIRMPQMSGIELVERVRKIDKRIKVIFMTAFDLENDKVKEVKNSEFLKKPVRLETLMQSIIRLIETHEHN